MAFGDTIAATVLGKPTVPQDTDATANAVAEGAAVNTTVGITAHSSFANGSADVDYSLSADSSGGGFKINQSTGVVTVADPSKIDFESAPGHLYTITVLATKNNSFSSEQTFTISVNDVAPSAPVDSNAAANTVLEGAATGTTVGVTASSTDVNGGAVAYSLIGDTSGGGFTVNATTGVVTVADGSKIDFESSPGHAYTVTVQSSDGTLTSSQAFTVNVGDVAMTTPVDSNGAANSVAEGAANGTAVGITASAGDPNGPATTYSLTNDAGGRFAINATTGVVTVANGAAIDFETAPGHAYGITVQAASGAQTTSQAFSVGVTDVGPSTPTDANLAGNTVFELAANGTAVGITAFSSDPGGGPAPTFALTDSAGGRFAINATTGVVTVANGAAIDFETAPSHAYSITVQSTAGALSSLPQAFSIGVANVNEAPAGANKTVTIAEDNAYAFGVADFGFSDPADSSAPNSLQAVKMTTLPVAGTGTFTNNGVTVNAGDSVSATDIAAGHLVFTPALNANGSPEASFTFQVQDNGGTANGGVDLDQSPNTVTINVTAVNDAPVNSVPGTQSVNEDATLTFSSGGGNAITISDVDVGAGNETVTLTVTSGTLALGSTAGLASFTNNAASITLSGTVANINAALNGLTYHGNLNFNGTDTLIVSTNDNGNTGSGGSQIDTDNVTINVTSVNDAPAGADKTVTIAEDNAYVFGVADFGFTDPNDSSAPNSLLAVKMTTVPGAGSGTFTNNGVTVNAGDSILATDIAAGHLVFTPALNANGSPEASFTFQVQDNGGTANGGVDLDQSPNTLTINVTAVNDAPVNSVPGTQSVNEDATLTFSSGGGNAITISDVDVGAGNETVTLSVTSGTLALGSTAGLASFTNNAASITLSGTVANINAAMNGLTYHGNLNFNGADTLVVSTNDNGNTGSGGAKIDTDNVTINVTSVNDAPAGTDKTVTTAEDNAYVFGVADFGFTDPNDSSAPNSLLAVKMTTVPGAGTGTFTNNGVTVNAGDFVLATDIAAGHLVFTPALNVNGSPEASFTFQVQDNGGTANGGVALDQSANTLTINVTPVNDAPVNSVPGTQSVNEDATLTFSSGGGNAITISDVDVGAGNETVTLTVTSGTLALGSTAGLASFTNNAASITLSGTVANINAALDGLTYHGNLNFNGTDTLIVSTNDNGNTGSGGSQIDTDNVTINVTSVNDAPAGTDKTVTMVEGDSYTFSTADFGFTDPNDSSAPNSLLAVKMTTVPGAGSGTFTNNGVTVNAGDSVLATDIAAGHLVFTPTAHSNGAPEASFTFQVQDNGGTANGGVDLDQSANTVDINVNAVNDAPINSVPLATQNVNEEGTLTFSSGNGNAITISDIDVGSGNETVTLSVTGGTLALGPTAGLASFTNNASSITLTGTVANVNAAMNGLTYTGNLNFNGNDTLVVSTTDNGNTGAGGPQTDTDGVNINVAAVNDAPVNGVSGTQTVNEDTALVFSTANSNAITISDVDANGGNETVTLSVASGALTLSGTTGLVFGTGDGTADSTMTFSGTVGAINTALNGMSYQGNLNFNGSDTLNITTNDNGNTGSGGAKSDTDAITINVTAVNDVPSFTVGANQTVLEDSGLHTVNGFATGISRGPANENSQTVDFITSNDNNALFSAQPTIDASGNLTYTSAANANGVATVTVRIHDDGGTANGGVDTSASQTFTVTVGQVNDAPAGTDNNTIVTLEDTSHTFTAAEFGFSDPVDAANASGANAFLAVKITTVPGAAGTLTDNGVTLVAGNTVTKAHIDSGLLVFNPAANANGSPEASFTFQVQDNGGTANAGVDTDQSANLIQISVTSVNDAPAGANKTVGTAGTYTFAAADFGFTDPADAGSAAGANAFQAVKITTAPGTGTLTNSGNPVNPGDFILVTDIAAGHLVFTPDVGGDNDSFTFQVQDNGGTANSGADLDPTPRTFTINQDVAPTVTAGDTLNYTENATSVIDPTITITDPDNGNMVSAKVSLTTGFDSTQDVLSFTPVGVITGSYNPATGVLSLSGNDSKANYELALESVTYHNTSDDPNTAQRTVTYVVNDGTLDSAPGTATINVNAVNDAPATTAGGTLNYTENQAATVIDASVTATDVDNANLASATVAITTGFASGQDVLDADVTGTTIIKSYNAGTGVLSLSGSDTKAHYQQVLDSVTYFNSSENPSGANRIVSYTVNDGALNSNTSTATVHVTPVNDPPATTAGGTLNYTENQAATVIDSSVTVTDADNANMISATVAIGTGFASGQDVLDANVTGTTIGKSYNAATGVLTLSGSDTKAHYQQVLDSVTYFNSSDNPSGAARTVSYTVNDGTVNSNTSTATVNVTPVNDAPVVTATGTLAYTEDQGPAAIAPALTVTDADTGTLTTASVHIGTGYVTGEDVLAFSDTANITGTFDPVSGTMTLNGIDTVANYQAALRTVTYTDTSQNPSTAARTVTFTADDGQGANHLSAGSNHTITVASVDDAPTNNGVPASFVTESGFAHTITGLSITDVDAGAFNDITTTFTAAAGTVSIGNGTSGGTAGISGGATITTNGSGTVVLTGTVGQINTSLAGNNVAYTAADNVTTPTTTTLSMATNDHGHTGTGGPITDTDSITVGVIPQVWFINGDQTGADSTAPRGSQTNPFATVDEFNASSGPGTNDYIYVKAGTYSGDGINLKTGQTLLGDDQALSFTNPLGGPDIVIEDGTHARPTINVSTLGDQGIALASGNTVKGIVVTTNVNTQVGIDDSGASVGALNISDTDVTGAGQAINVTHGGTGGSMAFGTVSSSGGTNGIALGGTLVTNFSATAGTLSGHSGPEFLINGGSGTVSYAGTIGDGSGLSASIASRTAGAVTLSGNINDGADVGGGISVSSNTGGTIDFTGATKTLNTDTANAVSMTGNGGATVNFTGGGLNIDTTSGIGFSANTGTVSVTGSGNTINTTSGTALNLAFLTVGAGGVTFDSATTTSAPNAISINTVSGGAINVNGGSIAGATSNGVNINAAQDNISIASSIASTSAGHSVQVTGSGTSGGNTITFSGGITDPGLGVNLDNNDVGGIATINFTGALNIDSTTHTGFNAINGGTVNANNAANSIVTTTGTALNVNNTTIGGSGLVFHDISAGTAAGGPAKGISLNNAGSGGLTVNGTGTTDGSGGTIQDAAAGSTMQRGIEIINTNNVTLKNMALTNADRVQGAVSDGTFGGNENTDENGAIHLQTVSNVSLNNIDINGSVQHGINGNNVTNLDIANSTIQNTGNAVWESGIYIFNLKGTSAAGTDNTISGTTISHTGQFNLFVQNNSATNAAGSPANYAAVNRTAMDQLTLSGDTLQDSGVSLFGDNATIISNNGGNLRTVVTNSTFTGTVGGAFGTSDNIQVDASGTGHADTDISGSTFSGGGQSAINISGAGTGFHTFNVHDNTSISVRAGVGVNVAGNGDATMRGFIQDNPHIFSTVPNNPASGIQVFSELTGQTVAVLDNNVIETQSGSPSNGFQVGIKAYARGTGELDLTAINNTVNVSTTNGFEGITVDSGNSTGGEAATVRLKLANNSIDGQNGADDYVFTQYANDTFSIEGLVGSGTNAANVAAFVASTDTDPSATDPTVNVQGGLVVNYTAAATPQPLLAAAGGVQASSPTPGETHLTQAQLDSVVAAAIAQWAAAGASAAQLAALAAIVFTVDELSGNVMGEQTPGHIVVDTDAAGHGWFVDPTPNDNSEFTHAANAAGTDLYTDPSNAAAGHLDLLTAVSHEMGHELGLDDVTDTSAAHDLMFIDLVDGERRLPDATDVVEASVAGALQAEVDLPASAQAAAGTPMVVGTAGNDTINAGHGGNILFGGGGADNFVFGPATPLNAPTPAQITHVADYHAAEGDTFDFSAITSAFHNSSVSDALVVRAVEDASGKFATLQVDHIDPMGLPSAPNWVNVAQLDGVHAGDSVNVLIDNHSVHLAQIHVDLLV